jgi:site-specific recombinase XerD
MDLDFPLSSLYEADPGYGMCGVVQCAAGEEGWMGGSPELGVKVLADLVHPYLRERVRRREMTKDTARNNYTALMQFARLYGRRPVANLSRRDVERWLEEYGHLAAGTRRSRFSMLRCWFDWLVDRGHIKRSPTYEMKAPKKPRAMKRALPLEDVRKTLAAADDQRARLIAVLMLQLGLRAMEVARLELGDIDLPERMLLVREGKGGHQRALYITDECLTEMHVFLGLFPANAGPLIRSYQFPTQALVPGTIGNICRRMLYEAGVKQRPRDGVSGHALRHTCFTDMLRNGAPIRDVQATAGHRSIATTEDYLPLLVGTLRDAMEGRSYTEHALAGCD